MRKIGLHIGLPKTGTTSLQRNFFNHHPGLLYWGQSHLNQDINAKSVLKALLGVEGAQAKAKKIIQHTLQTKPADLALMISDEAMSMGQFMVRSSVWPIVTDHNKNAQRAKQLLGSAEIFIVLRNQVDWLTSWHLQGLYSQKYHTVQFDDWWNIEIKDSHPQLLKLLDYHALYRAYKQHFGKSHVHLFCFEQFSRTTFGELAAYMADSLSVNANLAKVSMGHRAHNVTKNKPPIAHYKPPTDANYNAIKSCFNESNQAILNEGVLETSIGEWDAKTIKHQYVLEA